MTVQCARPQGTGYDDADRPLIVEMQRLLNERAAMSATEAARMVADRARGASPEAIVDRLVRKHARFFPVSPGGPNGGESDSVPTMMTPTPQHADQSAAIAALKNEVATLAERNATLEGIVAEQALQLTHVFETITANLTTQHALTERVVQAFDHIEERLERHADGVERLVDDRLPRTH